jgi:protein associated with RNAse G/E
VGRCWAAKAGWAKVLWWAETSRWAIIAVLDNGLKWFLNLIKAFGFENQGFKYFQIRFELAIYYDKFK